MHTSSRRASGTFHTLKKGTAIPVWSVRIRRSILPVSTSTGRLGVARPPRRLGSVEDALMAVCLHVNGTSGQLAERERRG